MRTLRKELQYYKKRDHIVVHSQEEEISNHSEDTQVTLETRKRCEECARGHYEEIELMGRTYGTCTVCENRKRLK